MRRVCTSLLLLVLTRVAGDYQPDGGATTTGDATYDYAATRQDDDDHLLHASPDSLLYDETLMLEAERLLQEEEALAILAAWQSAPGSGSGKPDYFRNKNNIKNMKLGRGFKSKDGQANKDAQVLNRASPSRAAPGDGTHS